MPRMAGASDAAGMELQKQLSEFLYAELLHSLGVYNGACEKLETLRQGLKGVKSSPEDVARWRLKKAANAAFHCNSHLRDKLHYSADVKGQPTKRGQPSPFPAAEDPAYPAVGLLNSIVEFYEDTIAALRLYKEDPDEEKAKDVENFPGHVLGFRLAFIHDPQRRREELTEDERVALIEGKIARHQSRRDEVKEQLLPTELRNRGELSNAAQTKRFRCILQGDAGANHSLLLTIIEAMSEAHVWMHQAEHIQSKSFGKMLVDLPEIHARSQHMLRYSLVLNTFVYMAAKSTPWIFAEDERERDYVISNYDECVRTLAPTYCIWISVQLSLLALHRRAFTHWSMGRREWAYRDFHKLIRLLRGLREPAGRRGLRVPGTNTFIEGMTGMSELHIGRIYRGQHAHKMAIRYFERASHHLKGWEEHEEIGDLVRGSHWRVSLLINEGEANYQLGRVKRSILSYARAWRAYLRLVEAETHATANVEVANSFMEWLEPIVDDPDVDRWELRARITPLVDQFGTLRTPPHLRSLAADIVMRMGHLLFVLKLPPEQKPPKQKADEQEPDEQKPRTKPPMGEHDLAKKCIAKAAFLDPTNTMSATDLLKIEYEFGKKVKRPDEGSKGPPKIRLRDQWPTVSGGFEEAAQVTEYVLQGWLKQVDSARPDGIEKEKKVALDLLKSFLSHTDSSNVKLAQVYRYLMQDRRNDGGSGNAEHSLDFVCMRRYSSFFPFLPRPSAFRAPGGGYFIRACEPGRDPFGIAIDPGPDFIENLYRCGFALADIQMIVVTHDHADHIASLDALLALMYYRGKITTTKFGRAKNCRLAIVGNKSVYDRYRFYNEPDYDFIDAKYEDDKTRKDAIRVLTFKQMGKITRKKKRSKREAKMGKQKFLLEPETLRIEPVKTWGHQDATGNIAQGFLLSIGPKGNRSSILFTGDTGIPPELPLQPEPGRESREDLLAKGKKGLREAVEEADVIVAHLSSVPLVELRSFAGLDTGPDDPKPQLVSEYAELWKEAVEKATEPSEGEDLEAGLDEANFLLKQIQFGFRVKKPRDVKAHVSPFDHRQTESQSKQHLYLKGLLEIAKIMAAGERKRGQLLLLGELREELGTFRTSISTAISDSFFEPVEGKVTPNALTADIGLRVRLTHSDVATEPTLKVLCTTCDLDNDLVPTEKFHAPGAIDEVCVKGEDEGVFYNCWLHNPRMRDEYLWVEAVERYDVFGE
jgi:glyoxylase-like metal-dependent hydrolase (beta-lactamase superfamily II)/tetratricopeptide (TPR) repeat protein